MDEALTRSARQFPRYRPIFMGGGSRTGIGSACESVARALPTWGQKGRQGGHAAPQYSSVVIAIYGTFRIGAVAVMNIPSTPSGSWNTSSMIPIPLCSCPWTCFTPDHEIKDKPKSKDHLLHINDYFPFQKQLFPFVKRTCTGRSNLK